METEPERKPIASFLTGTVGQAILVEYTLARAEFDIPEAQKALDIFTYEDNVVKGSNIPAEVLMMTLKW